MGFYGQALSADAEHVVLLLKVYETSPRRRGCRRVQLYIPVLRTLLTAGGDELIERPDRLCSIPAVPGGDKDGGLTEDSWT